MTEQPGGNPVPDWRRGAVYHRPLTDADGFATGFEVTVYPTLMGDGRFCVGRLAAGEYEYEYMYDTVMAAVEAAREYDGNGPPSGDWHGYKARTNGDVIESEESAREPTEMERRDVVGGLMPKVAPFQRKGQGEDSIEIEAGDEIHVKHDLVRRETIVTIKRTTFEVHDRPAPARTIYRAVLEYDGAHDFKIGSRLRVNRIESVMGV